MAALLFHPATFTPFGGAALEIWSAPSIHAPTHSGWTQTPVIALGALSGKGIGAGARLASVELALLLALFAGALFIGHSLGTIGFRAPENLRSLRMSREKSAVSRSGSRGASRCPFPTAGSPRAYVVVPESFLADGEQFRLTVLHELQHHRQGDTAFSHLLQGLKLAFFWNPLFHLWEQGIASLQEFACDEALVDLKQVSPHAYGGCLLKAANTCLNSHAPARRYHGHGAGNFGQNPQKENRHDVRSKS